jgi:hypothetical protein
VQPFEGVPEELERRAKLYHLLLYELVRPRRHWLSEKETEPSFLRMFLAGVLIIGLTFLAGLVTLLFVWICQLVF